jgi:glycosyltransferase involved in cell wall biosynthesis
LESRVHLLPGGLWGEAKWQALRDAACFALPSRTENFGIAVAEAAAAGLPVVVSDRCGVAEYLSPGATIVVPPSDIVGLALAIERAIDDESMRHAAMAWIPDLCRSLDWGVLVDRQLQIYEEALGRQRIGGG